MHLFKVDGKLIIKPIAKEIVDEKTAQLQAKIANEKLIRDDIVISKDDIIEGSKESFKTWEELQKFREKNLTFFKYSIDELEKNNIIEQIDALFYQINFLYKEEIQKINSTRPEPTKGNLKSTKQLKKLVKYLEKAKEIIDGNDYIVQSVLERMPIVIVENNTTTTSSSNRLVNEIDNFLHLKKSFEKITQIKSRLKKTVLLEAGKCFFKITKEKPSFSKFSQFNDYLTEIFKLSGVLAEANNLRKAIKIYYNQ